MITSECMRKMRRAVWEKAVGWEAEDLDRKFEGNQVLQEDLQDMSQPMAIIGTDVVNLYPSLDIDLVVREVEGAILESGIKWEEIDYMEGARYVALNWTEAECRNSGLRRILPRRRNNTGCRPGLRGVGPQGGDRGDQEQWVFPPVRLTQ